MAQPETLRIMITGVDGVGKSRVCLRFTDGRFYEEYDPTISDSSIRMLTIDQGPTYRVELYDMVRAEDFGPLRNIFARICSGIICLYSITSRESFAEVDNIRREMSRIRQTENFPFILCGNKSDLESQRQVTKEEGRNLAKFLGCPFFETSARSGANVDEMFVEMVRVIERFPKSVPSTRK
eukprot:TRINITY_DN6201_c0_g1_i1.p1 TRINITY_DN6201_c0_g1~~TRINITY_DN6201_c0_g1_i1.p1  ORF type:complete len:181 (-),score=34.36 TRINITY_DN6201_c0_g1_i1:19-561(-)